MAEAAGREAPVWHAVPVPLPAPGRTCAFEAGGERLLLCNVEGTPYVVKDECPHVRVPLSGGTLRGSVLECPLHGGRLDVRDGAPVERPIRKRISCYAVRHQAGILEVAISAAHD